MVEQILQAKFERFSQFHKDKVRREINEEPNVMDTPLRRVEEPHGVARSEAREKLRWARATERKTLRTLQILKGFADYNTFLLNTF